MWFVCDCVCRVCGRVRGTAFASEFVLLGGGTLAIGFGKERGAPGLRMAQARMFWLPFLPSVSLFLVDFNLN